MPELDPWVMVREADRLAGDLAQLVPAAREQLRELVPAPRWTSFERVVLTGSGDSFHAAAAAALAIEQTARVPCRYAGALAVSAYSEVELAAGDPSRTLVVGITASGATPSAIAALRAARAAGTATLAITGAAGAAIAADADATLVLPLHDREPSPGVRTWQASVVGLMLLGDALAEARLARPRLLAAGVTAMAVSIEHTRRTIAEHVEPLAEELAAAATVLFLGSGPSRGVAMFGAAKLIEAAGVGAFAQDVEEWSHVERLLHPLSLPVILLAPPGRAHRRVSEVAARARAQGRRLIAVVAEGDREVASHADVVVQVSGAQDELLSPLVTHLLATELAPRIATHRGRRAFQPPGHA